jgi:hypothetical protein
MVTFSIIFGLAIIAVSAARDAYRSTVMADKAMELAERTSLRLDRLNKASNVSVRETMAVSYTEGWSPRESWVDDFNKTRLGARALRPSMLARLRAWFYS